MGSLLANSFPISGLIAKRSALTFVRSASNFLPSPPLIKIRVAASRSLSLKVVSPFSGLYPAALFSLSFNVLYSANPSAYQLSFISSNRYCVSFHSFNAIFILDKKSFLLCASCASTLFAQILVPLLNICLLRTNSLLAFKCL